MDESRFEEKLFSVAGNIIGEYHEAKLRYEEAENRAELAFNKAKKLRQDAENYMLDMIKKEEEKNIAIEEAVRSFQLISIEKSNDELT